MSPDPQVPFEPSSDMRTMAVSLFNMYRALQDAGFTAAESIAIIGQAFTAALGTPKQEE